MTQLYCCKELQSLNDATEFKEWLNMLETKYASISKATCKSVVDLLEALYPDKKATLAHDKLEWLENVSRHFNPGPVTHERVEIWNTKKLTSRELGLLRKLRLIKLLLECNDKCFYDSAIDLQFRVGTVSSNDKEGEQQTELAEIDHIIARQRAKGHSVKNSPIVIASHQMNRMRGHIPFGMWLRALQASSHSGEESEIQAALKQMDTI